MKRFKKNDYVRIEDKNECQWYVGTVVSDTNKKIVIIDEDDGKKVSFNKKDNIEITKYDHFPKTLNMDSKKVYVLTRLDFRNEVEIVRKTAKEIIEYLKENYRWNCCEYSSFEEFIQNWRVEKKEMVDFVY